MNDNEKKCKNCKYFTWACPNWMCMNEKHPNFTYDDMPLTVKENEFCDLFEKAQT